jgi:hypothetical protein
MPVAFTPRTSHRRDVCAGSWLAWLLTSAEWCDPWEIVQQRPLARRCLVKVRLSMIEPAKSWRSFASTSNSKAQNHVSRLSLVHGFVRRFLARRHIDLHIGKHDAADHAGHVVKVMVNEPVRIKRRIDAAHALGELARDSIQPGKEKLAHQL